MIAWFQLMKKSACSRMLTLAVFLPLFFAGGCALNYAPYVTEERLDKGLIVILHGIEGPGVLNANIRQGFMNSGLPYAMEIYNWLGWKMGYTYAYDKIACRERAQEIAEHIDEYRLKHPDGPVFIVGHSGGGAIAVFATEAMLPTEPIDGVILLAPALSPGYPLLTALIRCDGHMINCYTETDLLLPAATSVGKNLDGIPGDTAGHSGFIPSKIDPSEGLDGDLRQIEWKPEMAKKGNFGGHSGWASPAWVEHTLAPIIREWAKKKQTKEINSMEIE